MSRRPVHLIRCRDCDSNLFTVTSVVESRVYTAGGRQQVTESSRPRSSWVECVKCGATWSVDMPVRESGQAIVRVMWAAITVAAVCMLIALVSVAVAGLRWLF